MKEHIANGLSKISEKTCEHSAKLSGLARLPRIDVAYALITSPATGRILMVGNRRERGLSWSLPGGKREPGETFEQTAVREVREETGLEVEVGGLVAVGERFKDAHALIFTFLARVIGGEPALRSDEEVVRLDWATVETAERRMPWYPGGIGALTTDAGAIHYSEYL